MKEIFYYRADTGNSGPVWKRVNVTNQEVITLLCISRLVIVKHVFPTFSRNGKISISQLKIS